MTDRWDSEDFHRTFEVYRQAGYHMTIYDDGVLFVEQPLNDNEKRKLRERHG